MEQVGLEHEIEKRGYDTFDPDTFAPVHVPQFAAKSVPIQVALAPIVPSASPVERDHEFDALEAYQRLNAEDHPPRAACYVPTGFVPIGVYAKDASRPCNAQYANVLDFCGIRLNAGMSVYWLGTSQNIIRNF